MEKFCKALIQFLIIVTVVFAQKQNVKFTHLTINDGLPDNRVYDIQKDYKGFMWFATYNGLARFDGYSFKVFKFDSSDTNSVRNNGITTLYEDRDSILWYGLDRYDRLAGNFKPYYFKPIFWKWCSHGVIREILQDPIDSLKVLWIGDLSGRQKYIVNPVKSFKQVKKELIADSTEDGYVRKWVRKYRGRKGYAITYHRHWVKASALLRDDLPPDWEKGVKKLKLNEKGYIGGWKNFMCDTKGNIWSGSFGGLIKYDGQNDSFKKYIPEPGNPYSINSDLPYGVFEDKEGFIWVGTEKGGLNRFDPATETFTHYKSTPENPNGLATNNIFDVYGDSAGRLWVTTKGDGFYRFDRETERFIQYKKESKYKWGHAAPRYLGAVYYDNKDKHWIGTADEGVYMFDPLKQQFQITKLDIGNKPGGYVTAFHEFENSKLWIATTHALYTYNKKTGELSAEKYNRNDKNKLLQHPITNFYKDKKGNLWIGTTESGGLKLLDNSGNVKSYTAEYSPVFKGASGEKLQWFNTVNKIAPGNDGNLLLIMNTTSFDHYVFNTSLKKFQFHFNGVRNVILDNEGYKWFGRGDNGLSRRKTYNEPAKTFVAHKPDEPCGLSNNLINTMHIDSLPSE